MVIVMREGYSHEGYGYEGYGHREGHGGEIWPCRVGRQRGSEGAR
jgi:hypothetical protein